MTNPTTQWLVAGLAANLAEWLNTHRHFTPGAVNFLIAGIAAIFALAIVAFVHAGRDEK